MEKRVREDLRWLAQSPELVTSEALACETVGTLPETFPTSDDLVRAMKAKGAERFRLGAYFEGLVEAHLRHHPGASHLRSNIVIRGDKRTLGELDFLFDNEHQQTEHWEVAVKFYLYAPGYHEDTERCFLGPRTIDNLARKVERMRDHQLQLPQFPAANEAIETDLPIRTRALLRGRLFYPIASNWENDNPSALATSDHLRGWWTKVSSSENIPEASHYLIVDKHDWMTCPPPGPDNPPHRLPNLIETLKLSLKHPVQVIGVDDQHRELHRGFVVPDHWPHGPE